MNTSQFSICNHCIHAKGCVLTNQKENVFSCSEYDDEPLNENPEAKETMSTQDAKVPDLELQMVG